MYGVDMSIQCISFHPQKPLGLSNGGGAILHDDSLADEWYRKMRFDGRTEGVTTKDDDYTIIGEHCYMFPSTAAEGLHRLSIYAKQEHHPPMLEGIEDYPDCSKFPILGGYKCN
jgi:dTDP-4-amino-4,6-dideoxygalactose transaminase